MKQCSTHILTLLHCYILTFLPVPDIYLYLKSECDVLVPGIFHFFGGIGTGIGTNWYWKKVSEPVSEKLVTEKSIGTSIGKTFYQKKSWNYYEK